MRQLTWILLFFTCSLPFTGKAQLIYPIDSFSVKTQPDSLVFTASTDTVDSQKPAETLKDGEPETPKVKPRRRLVAALLCVALGPFGMHRLYLGTKPHVAAAYTLTLGGGFGLIPLIDLFHIVFDPNLYRYKDNDRFLMWMK